MTRDRPQRRPCDGYSKGLTTQLGEWPAPGDGHGIFEEPAFYEMEVNGVTLVDWVTRLITGEPLDDVHCDDCEP